MSDGDGWGVANLQQDVRLDKLRWSSRFMSWTGVNSYSGRTGGELRPHGRENLGCDGE